MQGMAACISPACGGLCRPEVGVPLPARQRADQRSAVPSRRFMRHGDCLPSGCDAGFGCAGSRPALAVHYGSGAGNPSRPRGHARRPRRRLPRLPDRLGTLEGRHSGPRVRGLCAVYVRAAAGGRTGPAAERAVLPGTSLRLSGSGRRQGLPVELRVPSGPPAPRATARPTGDAPVLRTGWLRSASSRASVRTPRPGPGTRDALRRGDLADSERRRREAAAGEAPLAAPRGEPRPEERNRGAAQRTRAAAHPGRGARPPPACGTAEPENRASTGKIAGSPLRAG